MNAAATDHAALLRKLIDVIWNQRRIDRMREVFAEDAVMHYGGRDLVGVDTIREEMIGPFQAAFPDMVRTIDDMVVEGDRGVLRFTASGPHAAAYLGREATGRTLTYEVISLFRLRDGRIAEVWAQSDFATRFAAL
ncbi:MAG: ester cyclase [Planctomycetes bacterium]|nr:ester cyclase [Planctomycetota bacterium]